MVIYLPILRNILLVNIALYQLLIYNLNIECMNLEFGSVQVCTPDNSLFLSFKLLGIYDEYTEGTFIH